MSLPKSTLCPPQNFLRPPALKPSPAHPPKKSQRFSSNFFSKIHSEKPRPPPFGQQKKRPVAVFNCSWISHFYGLSERMPGTF